MSSKSYQISNSVYPVCFGVSGLILTEEEKVFFQTYPPIGFILFARNIETPTQVRALVQELRELVGWHCPILIDQEGGRVARLKEPHWPRFPAMDVFANHALSDLKQAKLECQKNGAALAEILADLAITVNCAPVCDLRFEGAHDIIGDRSFGSDVVIVSELARAMADGMWQHQVHSIIKHIPGHGRALVDSHEDLPVVEEPLEILMESDFDVFKHVCDLPFAMTAHIVYSAIDSDNPATFSSRVINTIIRDEIGFGGIIFTDDLSMKALTGTMASRAERAMAAGCDIVLHCNGDMQEMQGVIDGLSVMDGTAKERFLSHYVS